MKTRIYTLALLTLFAAASCSKEADKVQPAAGELVTIRAILPEDDALKGAGVMTLLSWTWADGDKLTVVGETTEVFTIKPGFTPKQAEFVGKAVEGSSFTILFPGEDALTADLSGQVQKGNNNLDHLRYQAALKDVNDYSSFAFSAPWAAAHGGSLQQEGVLKFELTPPDGTVSVSEVSLSADTPIFYKGNGEEKTDKLSLALQDVTLSPGDKLTAWMMTSWNELTVPSGTTLYVSINADGKTLNRDVLFSEEAVLKTGHVNLFTLNGAGGWADDAINAHYESGKGTKVSPWVVKTAEQFACIAGDLAEGSVRYYKLDGDIDLKAATSISCEGKKHIELDGNGHKIVNLSAPLFTKLDGAVKNLVIESAAVDGGSAICGALACTVDSDMTAVIENVQLNGSSVVATAYTGGLVGQADGPITLSKIQLHNTQVSGSLCGGIVGFANNLITLSESSVEGGSITASARYAGALVASAADYDSVISGCTVKDINVNSTADRAGGAIGQFQKKVTVRDCQVQNATVKGSASVGVFAGVHYGNSENCTASGEVTSTNTGSSTAVNVGGYAGYLQYGSVVGCSASSTVSATGRNIGGLVGNFLSGKIERSFATGNVTGSYRGIGGLVGMISVSGDPKDHTIVNSYSTGDVNANSYAGGLIGWMDNGTLEMSACYASGKVIASGFAAGGLFGYAAVQGIKISKCAAWASEVTPSSYGDTNWSSGAVIGVCFPTCTLTDNYRNPAMVLTAYWVPAADYQHPDVDPYAPLVKQNGQPSTATSLANGQDGYPIFPYHGKVEAGKTLSLLASTTLGWSADVWDFSADLPKFK